MKRQALYRLEWEDGPKGSTACDRPPVTVAVKQGPWGCNGDATLVYEGPLGFTTVTVEAAIDEDSAGDVSAVGLGGDTR